MGEIFSERYQESVGKLLDLIDEIRPLVSGIDGIDLPAVVVVGDQSVGKSSVLESIGGVALPRGSDIVTRCPLILQLRRNDVCSAEVSYQLRNKDVVVELDDVSGVNIAVQVATDLLCGTDVGVKDMPIHVRVNKPGIPDLTLIDLPGITRNPVGDQPDNIEEMIKSMISKYIEGESKVILCVIPADQDFTTCEGLKLAREHDPLGIRTLGVVTKVDKAESGIANKLTASGNSALKLKLGFVAVRNRTQAEVDADLGPKELAQLEDEFFKGHKELRDLPPKFLGKEALVKKLVKVQQQRVLEKFPALKDQVSAKIKETSNAVKALGRDMQTEHEAFSMVSQIVTGIMGTFDSLTRGQYGSLKGEMAINSMHVAPRVDEFFESYKDKLQSDLPQSFFSEDKFSEKLREMQKESRGTTLANFTWGPTFHTVFLDDVTTRLEEPSQFLVTEVADHVRGVLSRLVCEGFKEYPRLRKVVESEASWQAAIYSVDNTQQALYDVQICMAAYTKLVLKRVCDDVPLGIYEFLIHKVREGLASDILAGLEGVSLLYLVTDEERMDRRQQLRAELKSLQAVMVKLKGVSAAGGIFGLSNHATRDDDP